MSGGKEDDEEEDVRMKERREKKRTPTRNWICHTIVDETMKQKRGKYLLPKKIYDFETNFSLCACVCLSLSLSFALAWWWRFRCLYCCVSIVFPICVYSRFRRWGNRLCMCVCMYLFVYYRRFADVCLWSNTISEERKFVECMRVDASYDDYRSVFDSEH